ncbi:aminopeptidase N [Streptomyces calidiresistens]|uniref:Aminopeptidase N n=1 Tax=Streptomyces calidiresistens TaxID=1485586 RepID=A0A7W3XYC4_9ACTN|nr:aminopeptidase N [Streptomyces calidiresistens]MBB0231803.1 aminopeptidase N [Streptomyces calidiresistens]
MPGENLTREEARERAGLIDVDGYTVSLDLRSATAPAPASGPRTFRSTTTVRFRCAEPGASSFIDLIAPEVLSVTLNGDYLPVDRVFDGARIALPALAATNELVVDARCAYSRTGEGLHHFVDPEDGETYLYTQYEPADARRVMACFEQPDLKAPFEMRVTAPAHWTVLSNAEEVGEPRPCDNGAASTRTFAPTRPISTYITAVVAGPYHVERDRYSRRLPDGTTLEIPLAALCRKGLARHFDAPEIFDLTKRGLDFFHEHFDFPYPFGKYDQAFVPEYNIGAMENPGLVTFREEYVFRGRTTRAAYQGRANTLLHEMAHMWFGDLVTMEWWDDLWLKESFADFMGAFSLVKATRFTEGWITFANRRKAWAYRADQLPSTHPVTADIRDLQDAKLNFDGITYAKGASVLKQLVAYAGEDAFMEGARRYFRRHAWGNTTLEDLLAVLEETSGRDMGEWAKAWLQTAGVNALTPQLTCDAAGRVTELAVVQEAPEPPRLPTGPGNDPGAPGGVPEPVLRPHRVAIGLYRRDPASGTLSRYAQTLTDVTGARTVVPELVGAERPDLVLVNDEDLTYCKTRFDDASLATLREHLGSIADPLARALCWSALWNLTRDGLMPAGDFLDLVRRAGGAETEIGVLQMVLAWADTALTRFTSPADRPARRSAIAEAALRELRLAPPGGDHQLAWARFLAETAADEQHLVLLERLLDGDARIDGLKVDQELRWTLLLALAARGRADEERLNRELERDDTASGRRHHVRCLAARPAPEVKARAWADVMESDRLSNALIEATIDGFGRGDRADLLAPYTGPYFESLERVWAERSIEIGMAVVRGLFPAEQGDRATLEATDGWLRDHADAAPALRRLVLEARDDLARALRARECEARTAG